MLTKIGAGNAHGSVTFLIITVTFYCLSTWIIKKLYLCLFYDIFSFYFYTFWSFSFHSNKLLQIILHISATRFLPPVCSMLFYPIWFLIHEMRWFGKRLRICTHICTDICTDICIFAMNALRCQAQHTISVF